jgi:hypothetical protein
MASNAHDDIVGHQQFVDGEGLSNLDAGVGGCIRQEAVEHGAARTEPALAIVGVGNGAAKSERTDIECHVAADRRRPCRRQLAEETPPRQDLCAVGQRMWVEIVSLGKVARSTSTTLNPRRARIMAVGEPAHRAPTMMASYI